MSDITPATVAIAFWRWLWIGIGALVVLSLLAVGGWRAGWWFRDQNVNRQTQLLHGSYSYQSAEQADLSQKIADIAAETIQMAGVSPSSLQYADLHAQRLGEAQLACQDAAQITAIPAAETGWVRANCLAGAVNPSSPLEK
jgi:predicted negative regulator of RcsB-dependent stress response